MKGAEYRAAVAKAMTEDELLAEVRALAQGLGWLDYHTHRSQHSPAGFPDLVLVRRERLVFSELKREGKDPTPKQVEWLDGLYAVEANLEQHAGVFPIGPSPVTVHVWRPTQLLDGTIANTLR